MHSPVRKSKDSSALTVRPMSTSDVAAAFSILEESPEAALWSRASLQESASHGTAWVAELDRRVVGILIGRVAADEFEILNLAVGQACRRRGIATQLLSAAFESARSAGARQAFLEVRASNEGGIAFYMRMNFRICGCRPNYYRNPVENAVLLVLHDAGQNPEADP
ncbi:MAG TPA: ribosomal protein S18-alanine N-acetyltransferase [Candidatus Acidoferrales bacterium]|jgi:ribosomal-protein-alanine N-acetyltransferase|nr:ribosomal protein S18-alanine N-acetyltransferase [Candidatus Acidoferrales bacterium]